ncbi:hypothetical protein ACFSL4_22715 [Streptomyces caeni]|uniref:CAP domain-containing protein n=1 Tax=Streptomyces caeni TaxID=2307231 RepID=A0ABW4IVZ2_9ACTN
MSWEHRPGDGASGAPAVNDAADAHPASGPHQENGDPQGSPHVYHPYADAAPEYDRYADPAAAHGWQNAYDETQRLPPVSCDGERGSATYDTYDTYDGGPGPAPGAYGDGGGDGGYGPGPRAGSRRRARSAPRFRLPRPAVVAAGALGAVGVAVALAGAFSSGSSGAPGAGEPARPNVKPSLPLPEGPVSSATEPSAGATGSPSAGASSSASDAASGDPAGSPAPTTSAPAASPSATASATGTAGVVRKPGRGHGATKGPR